MNVVKKYKRRNSLERMIIRYQKLRKKNLQFERNLYFERLLACFLLGPL